MSASPNQSLFKASLMCEVENKTIDKSISQSILLSGWKAAVKSLNDFIS